MDGAFTLPRIEGRCCAPGHMLIMLLRHHTHNIKYMYWACTDNPNAGRAGACGSRTRYRLSTIKIRVFTATGRPSSAATLSLVRKAESRTIYNKYSLVSRHARWAGSLFSYRGIAKRPQEFTSSAFIFVFISQSTTTSLKTFSNHTRIRIRICCK